VTVTTAENELENPMQRVHWILRSSTRLEILGGRQSARQYPRFAFGNLVNSEQPATPE
jgi:hypothetical protein